ARDGGLGAAYVGERGARVVDEVVEHVGGRGVREPAEEELAGLGPGFLAPAGELGGARAEDGDLDRVGVAALVRAGDVAQRHEVVAEEAAGGRVGPGGGDDDEVALLPHLPYRVDDGGPLVERRWALREPEVRAQLGEAEEGDGQQRGVA